MSSLILASGSPRRKEILESMGFSFEVRTSDADEILPENYNPQKAAEYLAIQKNEQTKRENGSEVILSADTVVIMDDEILGKPKETDEAKRMLQQLSDRTHQVISGVCISSSEKIVSFSSVTSVSFKILSRAEIDFYIDKFQPFDKAGAYGIQEWIGKIGIESIEGSHYNVMGLPSHEVYRALTQEFSIEPSFKNED